MAFGGGPSFKTDQQIISSLGKKLEKQRRRNDRLEQIIAKVPENVLILAKIELLFSTLDEVSETLNRSESARVADMITESIRNRPNV